MNPSVPQSVIDEAYERDPGNAAADYGAEFRRDVETLISREAIDVCVVLTPDQSRIFLQELPRRAASGSVERVLELVGPRARYRTRAAINIGTDGDVHRSPDNLLMLSRTSDSGCIRPSRRFACAVRAGYALTVEWL
jgi:hypothetical protein